MTSFLLWNTGNREDADSISDLVKQTSADFLILLEYRQDRKRLADVLSSTVGRLYSEPASISERILLLTTWNPAQVFPVAEANRHAIYRLAPHSSRPILLACAHLLSRRNWSAESIAEECRVFSDGILACEGREGHRRTVVAGDFNLDPFDTGIVSAVGLHGVMASSVAKRRRRIVQGREYHFFYNPMWKLLGREQPGPPGTHYYPGAEHVCHFWHTYDQVLVRPDLLDAFPEEKLAILDEFEGWRDSRKGSRSDHFPVIFHLQLGAT